MHESAHPIQMMTNVGTWVLDKEATIEGLSGKVYYDPESIANIFGFSNTVDQYHVVYNSQVEDAFKINIGDKIIKFEHSLEGLYFHNVPVPNKAVQMINTVAENRSNYSTQQY